MAKLVSSSLFIFLYIISRFMSILGKLNPWNSSLPYEILSVEFAGRFRIDSWATTAASTDFGGIVHETPAGVLYPSSIDDIINLVRFSYNSPYPFPVAARGHGHSVRGQATAKDGVVVEMGALRGEGKIRVSWSESLGYFADVGGHDLWVDVLHACHAHGVSPASWTDYLHLTVGGTLSNAGISGQMFRYGPQISNVLELDIITGKGEFITCSKDMNSELFFGVLGGLGQFGIITRARIVLEKAPTRVKWVRMLYDDFSKFTRDQEHLISIHGLNYLEGFLMMNHTSPNNWRSSFFSLSDQSKIASLFTQHGLLYCLEVVKHYDDRTGSTVDQELKDLLKDLSFVPGMTFKKDASYFEFLNRVRGEELEPQENGLWEATHPWLNLFVPKSRILDFNSAVFQNIILKHKTSGPMLVYPTIRKMWDEKMSAVIPEEDTFYCVGLLYSGGMNGWKDLDEVNEEILRFCDKDDEEGSKIKQYLPHYRSREDWMKHFGKKWNTFQENKAKFDPKMILSPGQTIFNSLY
ncbi:PREDICTED: cytokinin dehydrogenase 3-like [Ipomoea nil]|uniref:cytokinin dehydrogenase 3-like n=1 Tax=Ipomoea nil TaxID=35883 RepID=UPI0009014CEE|nr:PREDICTED: cytokinin dehydrogenase 3-like [Ipomoea nil]